MILDSNIIIYAARPEHGTLRQLIADRAPVVSAASYVEVLGYNKLSEPERKYFGGFFEKVRILPLTQPVLDQAVRLRQIKKMSLGDSLIAGTALVHDLTLVTRNTDDFAWIARLNLLNPLEPPAPRLDEAGQ
jgi:predicted nucleic acid-binding protein